MLRKKYFNLMIFIVCFMFVFVSTTFGTEGFTSVEAVARHLSGASGGLNINNPIHMKINITLDSTEGDARNWHLLLDVIEESGRYVSIDLYESTLSANVFYPDGDYKNGKKYIVALVLPKATEVIPPRTCCAYAFDGFTNLNRVTLGSIRQENFDRFSFREHGNLRNVYLSANGGAGTYTRNPGSRRWVKSR